MSADGSTIKIVNVEDLEEFFSTISGLEKLAEDSNHINYTEINIEPELFMKIVTGAHAPYCY